jgi:hypothetical protein
LLPDYTASLIPPQTSSTTPPKLVDAKLYKFPGITTAVTHSHEKKALTCQSLQRDRKNTEEFSSASHFDMSNKGGGEKSSTFAMIMEEKVAVH